MDPHRFIILFSPFISHHVGKLRDKIMKNFVPLELDKSNGKIDSTWKQWDWMATRVRIRVTVESKR